MGTCTQADNVADMHRRGRAQPQHGENNPQVKLSDEQVIEIRSTPRTGASGEIRDLAERYGVNRKTIHNIVNDPSYRRVATPSGREAAA